MIEELISLGYRNLLRENDITIWVTKVRKVSDKSKFDCFLLNEEEKQTLERIENGKLYKLEDLWNITK